MWIWIWLAVIVICVAIECVTLDLVSIWFVLGGLISLILAGIGASPIAQVITAICVSFICLFTLRRFALKLLKKDTQKLNMDRTFGEKTKLITPITKDSFGTVKVNGVVYNAKELNGKELPAGTMVELVEMEGNKYIVKEII